MKRLAAAIALAFFLACNDGVIDRAEWQEMTADDRLMYVQTLIGESNAKKAKGGTAPSYTGPVNQYVIRIDAAYQSGDARPVHEIFAELGSVH